MHSDANRFVNYDPKTTPGHEIYMLRKEQHGCCFSQKKLEERNVEYLQIILDKTARQLRPKDDAGPRDVHVAQGAAWLPLLAGEAGGA